MQNTYRQLNMEKVLEEAISMIHEASQEVTAENIRKIYNQRCDVEDNERMGRELALAETIALGAITEQRGSNIQSVAAISYLEDMLSDMRTMGWKLEN